MTGQIGKDFSNGFFRDFTLYVIRNSGKQNLRLKNNKDEGKQEVKKGLSQSKMALLKKIKHSKRQKDLVSNMENKALYIFCLK